LSPALVDQVLQQLRISVLDLIDRDYLSNYLRSTEGVEPKHGYLPRLAGHIGPGHPWPVSIDRFERFPVARSRTAGMQNPVVAGLAEDPRMYPVFTAGDLALLDQGHQARSDIEQDRYYIVKRGESGLVRRLRLMGQVLYLIPEDCVDRPAGWERICLNGMQLQHIVRARATLLAKDVEWSA
jgi:hypothetical protein